MKKLLVVALMLVGVTQLQAQTKFGAQVNFTTSSVAGLGFGAHAEIFVNDKLSIQPAFDYYLSKDVAGIAGLTVSNSNWAINADAHYYFMDEPMIYGIGGLSFFNTKVSIPSINTGFGIIPAQDVSSSTFGVNIGAGAVFGPVFVEAKYNSPLAGLVLTAGFKFGGK